jgi:tRNA A37 threonylcarbamoyladenosine synthetase subunit TsaC/SUA5/YrdC
MAQFIKYTKTNPTRPQKVVKVLKEGGLGFYPTDTVYGLCYQYQSFERIAKIKG